MDKISRLLVFDLEGPMAHFRKYYTNSSALSYVFPPRTAIEGMLAAILGLDRDSYYDLFSVRHCHIAVSVKEPVRSIYKTVNYLYVKTKNDLNGSNGHTQVPMEIIMPKNSNNLSYRIYFWHEDEELLNKLCDKIINHLAVFPLYFGSAEFLCRIAYSDVLGDNEINCVEADDFIDINSIINMDNIKINGLHFIDNGKTRQYIKERAPLDFNQSRDSMVPADFLYEKSQSSISVKLNVPFLRISIGGDIDNITFMEAL